MDKNCYGGKYLCRLLLHFKGDITQFHLSIHDCYALDIEDITHWILFACRKGTKDLTLLNTSKTILKLPTQLFSCTQLKHLKLSNCRFHFPPTFRIELRIVYGELKLYVISELVNLKELSLSLCMFDNMKMLTSSGIIQLIGRFPKLEDLNLDFWKCKFVAETYAEKKCQTTFLCYFLESLKLSEVDFSIDSMVSLVFEMIIGSPNLQTLSITATWKDDVLDHVPPLAACFSDFECNKMGQLQLLEKKTIIHIGFSSDDESDSDKFYIAQKLLTLRRASPEAQLELD